MRGKGWVTSRRSWDPPSPKHMAHLSLLVSSSINWAQSQKRGCSLLCEHKQHQNSLIKQQERGMRKQNKSDREWNWQSFKGWRIGVVGEFGSKPECSYWEKPQAAKHFSQAISAQCCIYASQTKMWAGQKWVLTISSPNFHPSAPYFITTTTTIISSPSSSSSSI